MNNMGAIAIRNAKNFTPTGKLSDGINKILDIALKMKQTPQPDGKETELAPMLFFKTAKIEGINISPIQLPFGTSDEKHTSLSLYGDLVREGQMTNGQPDKVEEAILVTEAWYVKAQKPPEGLTPEQKKKWDEAITSIAPSQNPNRREAVILVYRNNQGKVEMVMKPFTKDLSGNITYEKSEIPEAEKPDKIEDNLLIHLFQETPKIPDIKEMLKEKLYQEFMKFSREQDEKKLTENRNPFSIPVIKTKDRLVN